MGDRGNIVVKQSKKKDDCIFLYTHWTGGDLPEILQKALARSNDRWEDPQYLTRIIFCDMVQGAERDTAGYGIGTCLADNEHTILLVDPLAKLVWYVDESLKPVRQLPFTFEQYCKATETAITEDFI